MYGLKTHLLRFPKFVNYVFCRVIFGAAPSQFLLNGAIKKLTSNYEKADPEFVKKVRRSFYVDDFCSGVESTRKGYQLYKKVKLRFAEAKFNVRKWVTNDKRLTELINHDENLPNPDILMHPSIDNTVPSNLEANYDNPKVLGINWDCNKDTFNLGVRHIFEKASILTPTKRNILKSIASIFDPCGFLQSITINLKILFQEVCMQRTGWDDVIEKDLRDKWTQIIDQLKTYKDVEIERYFFAGHISDPIERVYLHGFSDASELAYAACIYLKYVMRSGTVGVKFIK